ncbi:LYR motif-containing protein 1 isoform X2 [Meles meles]|uniref:LYR motif-containing protein 1 isoform X2 n=1 Tax=Meles meles TaxID=9662 RepID=UPI001E69C149|nr:LYR motif-containing protein 1 isoform X2 [Meles meles]
MTYAKTYEAVAKDPPGGLVRPGLPDLPDHPRPQLSEAPGTASSWPARETQREREHKQRERGEAGFPPRGEPDAGVVIQKHKAKAYTKRLSDPATRQEVLGLYRRIFRLARKWQAASGQMEDTIKEKQYILNEARTLFQKNKNLTDTDQIKQCIDECTARIEIGLHYQIPYPRPIHLPPMGLTPLRGRGLRSQEKLRKLSKPVYLKSHDEIS